MSTEKILIVEDEGVAAMNLEDKLISLGYQSAGIAFSAEEAIERAKSELPDLILMDIELHGTPDGIEAARTIRESLDIPVVYVTAFSDDKTIERAKETSPVGYLIKPYREQSIKTTIEIALNTFRLEKKLKQSERDFRSLFEMSPVGIALIDSEERIVRANSMLAKLYGVAAIEWFDGRCVSQLLARADKQMFPAEAGPRSAEYLAATDHESELWLRVDSCLVHEAQGGRELGLLIFSDISAQKALELTLQNQADSLQESNERLRHFTSLASHDLRAPARIAGQFLRILAKECHSKLNEREREHLGYAISQTKKMQATLEDLLEYTKVCHSGAEIRPVSLTKVMRDSLAILAPEIEGKRADVTYDLLPTVFGSEPQLRRLFCNLLSNAVKYSQHKPKVSISSSDTGSEFVISFSDNGIGIAESEREKVFDMFYRGSSGGDFPGTGIGLASCKKVVENHHGRIWVTSNARGGSTFHVAFPKELTVERSLTKPDAGVGRAPQKEGLNCC